MRHLTIFGALTALALASPAYARDGSHYVGFDAGLLMPKDIVEFGFKDPVKFGSFGATPTGGSGATSFS